MYMFFVYMIKNNFDKLYIGITKNPEERLNYHNSQLGAQFTKGKAKFLIVFKERHQTMTEARRREIQIKKWRRDKKEKLIKYYQLGLPTYTKLNSNS